MDFISTLAKRLNTTVIHYEGSEYLEVPVPIPLSACLCSDDLILERVYPLKFTRARVMIGEDVFEIHQRPSYHDGVYQCTVIEVRGEEFPSSVWEEADALAALGAYSKDSTSDPLTLLCLAEA